ncbi:MAG: chloride channel protein [Deltaproteobacteria bacterium HGW-Deltaproteobacteria-8]|jgi:CIC family chloride channel protein|nr:MAG: chloride channel protein [Deltaproteobacteria bacterium HGW-Deltaproteobacteria-8]
MWKSFSDKMGQMATSLRSNQHMAILPPAILIGILGGYGAVLFRFAIRAFQELFYGNPEDILTFAAGLPWWVVVGMPALGGLIVGLLVKYGAPEAKGHGVPEVMEAIVLKGGRIRKRVALVKILASAICIGSGGSVGREGPIVQIGSGVGSTLGLLLRVGPFQQKTLVGCGAAAGIAATFNAPIAGVLFALEVLLGDFGLTSFSPVVLSSVMATVISRHYFGDFPAFVIPAYTISSIWEYFIYPFLGIASGLVAVFFVTTLYKAEDLFDALKIPSLAKPVLGGLMMGTILLYFPQVFGVGYGAINLALVDQMAVWLFFALILLKILATSITIGSGGSGGVFAPSLFIGAMVGASFGCIAHALFPGITSGPEAYALVAMGALVAGTTHAPITAILIIFEMTNDYKIILPLMTSCIISTVVASALKTGNIYTLKLLRRGVDLQRDATQSQLRSMPIRDYMGDKLETISEDMPLPQIIDTFRDQNASYLHVLNSQSELTGIISFRDIRPYLGQNIQKECISARDVATTKLAVLMPGDSVFTAMQIMSDGPYSQLPVLDPDTKKLIGTLRETDVLAAYDKGVFRHGAQKAPAS